MLSNSLKIFSLTRNGKTTMLFYSIKGLDSKKSGGSVSDKKPTTKCDSTNAANNKKEKKASVCEVCRTCPCECNPSAPTMYDCRKYGHNLPSDSSVPQFETLQNIPTGIFRCTSEELHAVSRTQQDRQREPSAKTLRFPLSAEFWRHWRLRLSIELSNVLGRGAHKCSHYQNPEYFSYQHMTFYDIHLALRCYRSPSAKTGRKK